jgi:glyoxylase-like metal-dependent hydrolase (beta-lactamase superfamily II)
MIRQPRPLTRRQLLQALAACGGGALAHRALPEFLVADLWGSSAVQSAQPDQLTAMRAKLGSAPITASSLGDRLSLLAGPGGNVVVLTGSDGKIAVDGFVRNAWEAFSKALDGLGPGRLTSLIDTHWHFDHADNNRNARAAGASVIASDNTKKRLMEPHDILGMHFDPEPADALPNETFATSRKLSANGEEITLTLVPPAHTDTDVFAHFAKANVLHLGDVYFNGVYPFIDAATGGNIDGMIAGAERGLKMCDARTKVVPGHGPLGDRAQLTTYRDMLATIRDRVQKAKRSGSSLADVQSAKPTAEFDEKWGKGMMAPDAFVGLVFGIVK